MGKKPYQIEKIDDRTLVIREDLGVSHGLMYLLWGDTGALLIDTGYGTGDLRALVSGLTEKPVTVVNTHAHLDHIGANYQFGECWIHEIEEPVLALHTNRTYLSDLLKSQFPPLLRFLFAPLAAKILRERPAAAYRHLSDGHRFDLGGRIIEVIYTPGHSIGSICLLDRGSGILYSGDTVCDFGIMLNLELSTGPEVFLASVEKLQALLDGLPDGIKAIYAGHHRHPIGVEYIGKYIRCARGIIDGSLKLVKKGRGKGAFLAAYYDNIRISLPPSYRPEKENPR